MASTTSAAASMLLSGSSTSQPADNSFASFTNAPTLLNNPPNLGHFDLSKAKQVFLPNPGPPPLFPTITLDLTSASSSSTHINNRPPSNFALNPRFPPTSLSFCSKEPNIQQAVWGNGILNNERTHTRSVDLGNQFQQQFHQNCMENQAPSLEALAETLTKAISMDPRLRSVIAAAVSSIVGQASTNVNQPGGGEISELGSNLKLGQHSPFASSNPLTQNGKGCLLGYFNRLSSNSFTGNFMPLQPPVPFSVSKRSVSPSLSDQINH